MKENIIIIFTAFLLACSCSSMVFAESYTADELEQGMIVNPGDEIMLPDNTTNANLTAIWGVRVIFQDWDKTELKNELLQVTDDTPASTTPPNNPTREGYSFAGWDKDASVWTNVTGPGPIIITATYIKDGNSNYPDPVDPTPTTGQLIIRKELTAPESFDPNKVFTFVVRDADSEKIVDVATIKGTGFTTVSGLHIDNTYTVTEKDAEVDGYTWKLSVEGATKKNGGNVKISNASQTITFTNTYTAIMESVKPIPDDPDPIEPDPIDPTPGGKPESDKPEPSDPKSMEPTPSELKSPSTEPSDPKSMEPTPSEPKPPSITKHTPTDSTPKTGDNSSVLMLLWLFASGSLLIAIFLLAIGHKNGYLKK